MSKPASTAEFGTVVASGHSSPTAFRGTRPGRFADVKLFATHAMPQVKVGQVYRDLDPRCAGRLVQVLKVAPEGRVLVRTVAARQCAPRTPARSSKDTFGAVSWIALRRFRENSRGFALVCGTALRTIQSYLLGARLAMACGVAMSRLETKVADVLIGILGDEGAHEYLDDWLDGEPEGLRRAYLGGDGIEFLVRDALTFAREEGVLSEAALDVVSPLDATRRIARAVDA